MDTVTMLSVWKKTLIELYVGGLQNVCIQDFKNT
jgi:hypothetical protein